MARVVGNEAAVFIYCITFIFISGLAPHYTDKNVLKRSD